MGKANQVYGAGWTIRNEMTSLKMALDLARKQGHAVPELEFVKPQAGSRERILDGEELERLFAAMSPWFKRIATFAFETGMSKGDILRMR